MGRGAVIVNVPLELGQFLAQVRLLLAEFGLLIAIAVLVGVTYHYARETRKTALLVQTSTEQQVLPILVASLVRAGPVGLHLEITNVGLGAARNVRVQYGSTPVPGSWRAWEAPLMKAGQSYHLYIPTGPDPNEMPVEYFGDRNFTLAVQAEYDSLLGKHLRAEQEIDVSKWVEQLVPTRVPDEDAERTRIREPLPRLENVLADTNEPSFVGRTPEGLGDPAAELRDFVDQLRRRSRATPIGPHGV